ncbi:CoA-binding protein [Acrocarpospora pleiomorpha]|uniref:CoA-binding protein n=1 Tax=Acrocarpospora pleiomorpha TaxID=90975 RepID=A0A5M3XMK8_9ACTN|nr:CoA-binding protein [Acrocarpospora pleiomorpha]GES22474.1 CoA-binding protein [Acrocarpospora pleiomorpha]
MFPDIPHVEETMDDRFADLAVIRRLLHDTQTWAFVGLANNPTRTAYDQARLLQHRGKTIIPVHPHAEPVLGEKGYPTLTDIPTPVDVVAIYRRSPHAPEAITQAITIHAKAVWLPLNVIAIPAALRAQAAGLDVVMDRCPAVEWALRR